MRTITVFEPAHCFPWKRNRLVRTELPRIAKWTLCAFKYIRYVYLVELPLCKQCVGFFTWDSYKILNSKYDNDHTCYNWRVRKVFLCIETNKKRLREIQWKKADDVQLKCVQLISNNEDTDDSNIDINFNADDHTNWNKRRTCLGHLKQKVSEIVLSVQNVSTKCTV